MDPEHNIFPDEIICKILCFLRPQDILRLRLVSKRFRAITYDPAIWKHLYKNATFPRPPGPFPFQSTKFLEHTLVRSSRLCRTWTYEPIEGRFSMEIPVKWPKTPPRIMHGRWLIDGVPSNRIISLDLETNSRQVLWKQEDAVISWDACAVTSTAGQLVYIITELVDESADLTGSSMSPVKLVEFRANTDTGKLEPCVYLNVPVSRVDWAPAFLASGRSPFVYLRRHDERMIFDTRTRAFYKFPEFSTVLGVSLLQRSEKLKPQVSLTNTHIIVLNPLNQDELSNQTLIQVFSIPVDTKQSHDGSYTLHQSHECLHKGWFLQFSLTRNSIVDPVSGSTRLRYLCRKSLCSDPMIFRCLDIFLPKPVKDAVHLFSTDYIHELFDIRPHIPPTLHSLQTGNLYLDSSDDGYVRGFFAIRHPSDTTSIFKFTIDASGDSGYHCFVVLLKPSPIEGKPIAEIFKNTVREVYFDGVRGRVWFTDEMRPAVVRAIDVREMF